MSEYLERAKTLREDASRHYNCDQAVLMAFCERYGLEGELAYRLGECFGGGMSHGSTCGAVTGGLKALGLAGKDRHAAAELVAAFRAKNGCINCPELLSQAKARGEEKKAHCDRMVYDVVEMVEALLAE